jgi:dihydroorotase
MAAEVSRGVSPSPPSNRAFCPIPDLGNLSPGAGADVAVLRLERGTFGYTDMYGARLQGNKKLTCELTLRDGKVVWDLNGITRPDWTTLPRDYKQSGDARWDAITPAPVRPVATRP